MTVYHYVTLGLLPSLTLLFLTLVALLCCAYYRQWEYGVFTVAGFALLTAYPGALFSAGAPGFLADLLAYSTFLSMWAKTWGLAMGSLAGLSLIVRWYSEET